MAEAEHDDYCLPEYRSLFRADILEGKVALVTGGGSGIGFRITELLMRHGCHAAICSRSLGRLEESARRLSQATGKQCLALQMDVRKNDTVEDAVDSVLRKFGKIDILINSAAGNFLCPASSLSSNGFKTVMEIDSMGTFNTIKAVYSKYFKDHGGTIVNISATLHYTGTALQVHAGSAKAAIDAMTKHLAVEWGPQAIRINCIAPGPIEGTEGYRRLGGALPEAKDFASSLIPLRRFGTRTEIAEAAIFLCSPLSSFVTGTVLVVDGGAWLSSGQPMSMAQGKL